jgi:Family of unknown function (DUF6335)
MARKARKRPTRAGARQGSSPSRGGSRSSSSRATAKGRGRAAKPTKSAKAPKPARAAKAGKAAKKSRVAKSRVKPVKKVSTRPVRAKKTARPAAEPRGVAKAAKPVRTAKKAAPEETARPSHTLSLNRSRRHLPEIEDNVPTPPSSLDMDRTPSAARSGRREMREARLQHNETSPELTGGDVDASWEDAYAVGDEAPGGDNPTPDQDRVDDIGKALGVQYEDSEELKAADKITERDRHRWELDPASAEDYPEHDE